MRIYEHVCTARISNQRGLDDTVPFRPPFAVGRLRDNHERETARAASGVGTDDCYRRVKVCLHVHVDMHTDMCIHMRVDVRMDMCACKRVKVVCDEPTAAPTLPTADSALDSSSRADRQI